MIKECEVPPHLQLQHWHERDMREHSVEGRDKEDATEVCVRSFLQFYTGPRMVPHRVEAVGERIRWFDAKFEGLSAPSDPTHEQQ